MAHDFPFVPVADTNAGRKVGLAALQSVFSNRSPAPTGVIDLTFRDFFRQPTGPRGLELTETLRRANGQRIRILGYMVRQTEAWTNAFLLTAVPVQLHESEYGPCDDLPAATLYVRMPKNHSGTVAYTPKRLWLTGILRVGPVDIEDNRRALVSLDLDPPGREAAEPEAIPSNSSTTQEPTTTEKGT